MRGAGDGSARHVLAELQQDERRQRIGGILLAPEDRDFRMSTRRATFMQHDVTKAPTTASSGVSLRRHGGRRAVAHESIRS